MLGSAACVRYGTGSAATWTETAARTSSSSGIIVVGPAGAVEADDVGAGRLERAARVRDAQPVARVRVAVEREGDDRGQARRLDDLGRDERLAASTRTSRR